MDSGMPRINIVAAGAVFKVHQFCFDPHGVIFFSPYKHPLGHSLYQCIPLFYFPCTVLYLLSAENLWFREERLAMREDCNDKSMSFIVVSSTCCPDVRNAAFEDCREEIVCSRCWSVLTVFSAWCEESILILALDSGRPELLDESCGEKRMPAAI